MADVWHNDLQSGIRFASNLPATFYSEPGSGMVQFDAFKGAILAPVSAVTPVYLEILR